MPPSWETNQPQCENCRTKRRPRRWRGYCKRCYPLILKIDRLQDGRYRSRGRYPKLTPSLQKIKIKQSEWELTQIKKLESPLVDGPNGSDIEGLVTTLVNASNSRQANQYYNCYKIFDNMIDDNARWWIYYILLDIVENLPCHGARKQYANPPFRKNDS